MRVVRFDIVRKNKEAQKLRLSMSRHFPEVKLLLEQQAQHKKALRRLKSKLEREMKRNDFLIEMLWAQEGLELLIPLQKLFWSIGYKDVKIISPKKRNIEDMHIKYNDKYIYIEGKCQKNIGVPEMHNVTVIHSYVETAKHREPGKDIVGLFIINPHCAEFDIRKRKVAVFDDDRKEKSLALKFGMITTLELLNGFQKLKQNQITFEDFHNTILQHGEIKFSGKKKESKQQKNGVIK